MNIQPNQTIDEAFGANFSSNEKQPSIEENLDLLFAPEEKEEGFDPLLDEVFFVLKTIKIDSKNTKRTLVSHTPAVCEFCALDILENRKPYSELNQQQLDAVAVYMKNHLKNSHRNSVQSNKLSQRQVNRMNEVITRKLK